MQGYQEAKQRYYTVQDQKNLLAADLEELQDKYGQKASQAKNLSERAAQLSAENEELRTRLGLQQPGPGRRHNVPGRHATHSPNAAQGMLPMGMGQYGDRAMPPQGPMTPRSGQLVPFQPGADSFPHQQGLLPLGHEPRQQQHHLLQRRTPSPLGGGLPNSPLAGAQYRPGSAGILQPHINGRDAQAATLRGRGVSAAQARDAPHPGRLTPDASRSILPGSMAKQPRLPGFPSSPSNLASM